MKLYSNLDNYIEIHNSIYFKNQLTNYENLLNNIDEKNMVKGYVDKLLVLNPLKTLKRGYTITKHDDKVISSKEGLEIGDELEVNFDDGSVNAKVVDLNNE